MKRNEFLGAACGHSRRCKGGAMHGVKAPARWSGRLCLAAALLCAALRVPAGDFSDGGLVFRPAMAGGRPVCSVVAPVDRGVGKIVVPESVTHGTQTYAVTHIGDNAFAGCSRLGEIVLPSTLEHIGSRAFSHCYRLREVHVPRSVRHIGPGAFMHCYTLVRVVLPRRAKLGRGVFCQCLALDRGGDKASSEGSRADRRRKKPAMMCIR